MGGPPAPGVAARFERVKRDEGPAPTAPLGLGKRFLKLGQRGGKVVASERDVPRRGEDVEIHLDQPDEARVLSGALERGLGRVLVAEGELGLGEQRQGLGGLTPAIVDRSWIRAGRCSAKEVLGERRGLLSAITA